MPETYQTYQVHFRIKQQHPIQTTCHSPEHALGLIEDLEFLGLQGAGTPENGRLGCQETMHYRISGERGTEVTKTELEELVQTRHAAD